VNSGNPRPVFWHRDEVTILLIEGGKGPIRKQAAGQQRFAGFEMICIIRGCSYAA
jgi:hypothetical protein